MEDITRRSEESNPDLTRRLGAFDSTMMMVGIVIGSGIFLTTGLMASSLPSATWVLFSWAAGGFLILAGALTYAELGACFPEAGGQYVYLREAYGPLWGFLFGWKMFLVNMTGSIAALAVAFAEYAGYFYPVLSPQNRLLHLDIGFIGRGTALDISSGQVLAVVVIWLFTGLNVLGVSLGKSIQNGLTVIKISVLVVFVGLGLLAGKAAAPDLSFRIADMGAAQILAGLGLGLVAVFWAFDGWNNINYVAGEIKNPSRNLPLALVTGTIMISVIYFLTNYVYFAALTPSEMAGEVRIAEKAASVLFGPVGAGLLSAGVLISVAGALNGAIFVGPRVYYAMARDGLFFQRVGRIHPRFLTPAAALGLQAIWASVLALTGGFEQLLVFAMFVGIAFWLAAAAAVFTLRRRRPDLPRPYRTWGYPWVPAVFVLTLAAILLNTVIKRPVQSLLGSGLVLLGLPVYWLWRRKSPPGG
jgi:APA family basic amino acid/polyamine antiporter